MKKIIIIPLLLLSMYSFSQTDTVNSLYGNGMWGKKLVLRGLGTTSTYFLIPNSNTWNFDSTKVVTDVTLNTTSDTLYVWKGEAIVRRLKVGGTSGGSSTGWSLSGNSGIAWNSNFIGTTDTASFAFRTNNVQRMIIDGSTGAMGFNGRPYTANRFTFWGNLTINGKDSTIAENAKITLNPALSGSVFDIFSTSTQTGSGADILPQNYLVLSSQNTGTGKRFGIASSGQVVVGAFNDLTSMFNVNTVNGTSGTIGLNQNGVNRWVIQNTGSNGDLRFINGSTALNFNNNTLNASFGSTSDDGVNKVQISGSVKSTQYRLSALNTAPTSATATGTLGEIRVVADFIYVCVAANTWVRTALTTW